MTKGSTSGQGRRFDHFGILGGMWSGVDGGVVVVLESFVMQEDEEEDDEEDDGARE